MRSERREPTTAREGRFVALIAASFAVVYATYGLFRHWRFRSSAFDLGIFDQAVWHMSRFEPPSSTISGFSNILGDHFYPIIALFVPLYWIAPAPETLIVAQAVLFAASIVPVYLFLRGRVPPGHAAALCVAYGFFWGLQRAAAFDVHEVAFAPLIVATLILGMDRRHWRLFWSMAVLLVLVKEDLIPVLTAAGAYLVLTGERTRGAALIAASILVFLVVVRVAIPAFNDAGHYSYGGPYTALLRQPWRIPAVLVDPPVKPFTALLWVAPFALLPLLSPLALLILPFVFSRFLSDSPTHWGTSFHYSAALAPILATSAGDGLARLAARVAKPERRTRALTGATTAAVLLSLFLPGNQPFWDLFEREHYEKTPVHVTGDRVVQLIPRDASVAAQAAVVPHLSQRAHITVLGRGAADAEIIIAAVGLNPWPASDAADLLVHLEEARRRGYVTLLDENGWTVLRRPPPAVKAP